jgi:integrase
MQIDLPEPTDTLSTFLDAYYSTAARDQKGKVRLKWTIAYWKTKYGNIPVANITRRSLSQHIETRRIAGKSNSTINREISILSASINYAIKRWSWNIANPASGLYLKIPEGRLRWLTHAEAKILLHHAGQSKAPHLVDFIHIALNTGMRRTEILKLELRQASSRMRSMRRSGSAAPHSNWSPQVKAPRYSGPMLSLRRRPTGTVSVPVTAAGVSSAR